MGKLNQSGMQFTRILLMLLVILLASCSDAPPAMPADWPIASMQLPAGSTVCEPLPAFKMAQALLPMAADEVHYSETVAFLSDDEFLTVINEVEASLATEGYWSIPGKTSTAINIRGYISGNDDAMILVMYTGLKDMFAYQAIKTSAPSEKLKERREQEGTQL